MPDLTEKGSNLWEYLKVSIWLVPLVMSVAALVLAVVMLEVDVRYGHVPWSWAAVLRIDAAGARQVVAVITGAMMTITGVVFSVTIVALTLASNQFGPKVLRNYLRDTSSKLVLGLFVATFVYGLLVLASVDTEHGGFVPLWSMVVNITLAVLATGGLIYFIHNISTSIQADHIIALIGEDLNHAIKSMLMPLDGESNHGKNVNERVACEQEWSIQRQGLVHTAIQCPESGYLQMIDYNGLARLAAEHNCFVEIDKRAGNYLIEHAAIGCCYAAEKASDELLAQLLTGVAIGRQRTPVQDIEFSIDQLVQVALRALSPGINDSLTCITCVNWLGAALGRMANCAFQSYCFRDTEGVQRVLANGFNFEGAVNAVFDPIRQNARCNEMVTIRLLEVLDQVIGVAKIPHYCDALISQTELIYRAAIESIPCASDREAVNQRFEQCKRTFNRRKRALSVAW
jgi:uncharacterized membrane protein